MFEKVKNFFGGRSNMVDEGMLKIAGMDTVISPQSAQYQAGILCPHQS